MAVVGQFPLLGDIKRRTIRAPVNPLDKSTVVSIFPKHIIERKWTIQPGVFEIQPGTYEKPAILVVGPSSWWKEIDENQPLLEIPHSSIQIADSVVKDYINGLIACDMGENIPGLFFIPGEFSVEQIKKDHKKELDEAQRKQKNWYTALVRMGDALWSRSNGNPLAISDDMKMAARDLNLINKEWLKDSLTMDLVRCVACGHLKNPLYPVCSNCKAISDPAKAKELGLVFAQ
ncbi:MAG: hypothetical protein ABWY25_10165 [Paenisporosarcina sp.]